MTHGGLEPGIEPAKQLREDSGRDQAERTGDGKGLIDKAKDSMKGS
jgi:hypothetical protein